MFVNIHARFLYFKTIELAVFWYNLYQEPQQHFYTVINTLKLISSRFFIISNDQPTRLFYKILGIVHMDILIVWVVVINAPSIGHHKSILAVFDMVF